MIRRRCEKHGHKLIGAVDGHSLPIQFCARWFCNAARVDPTLDPEIRTMLERTCPDDIHLVTE